MRVIACIEEQDLAKKILVRLGLPTEPLPTACAQAPPVTLELFPDRANGQVSARRKPARFFPSAAAHREGAPRQRRQRRRRRPLPGDPRPRLRHRLDAVCVHGRTVAQKYVGPSRRAFLKEAKAAYPTRVIVGSGDLCDEFDVLAMLRETGIDGARVARGGIGAPWVSTVPSAPTSRPSCGAPATSTSPKTTSVRSGTVRSRATSLPPAPAAADGHLTAAMDGDGDDA